MPDLQELLGSSETAGVWNLVPDRSRLAFKNKSMWGLLNVKGTFREFSGDGQVTGKGAVFGRVDIRAASVDTGLRRRDEHLRSADFFDVEKFPDISVVVTAAQPAGGDSVDLRASLTVKDSTLSIDLPATITVLDDGAIRVSAKAAVERDKAGIGYNMAGGMLGKVATLSADLVFAPAAG